MGHTVAELFSSSIITLILIVGISMTIVKHAVKRQNFHCLKTALEFAMKVLGFFENVSYLLYSIPYDYV